MNIKDTSEYIVNYVQSLLYATGCAMVTPALLAVGAFGVIAYNQLTDDHNNYHINNFLANIALQMLPLVLLKVKILACTDRVSIVPRALMKTLLMHVFLLVLRNTAGFMLGMDRVGRARFAFDVLALLVMVAALHMKFGFSCWSVPAMSGQRDVIKLVLLAVFAAFALEWSMLHLVPSMMAVGKASSWYTAGEGPDLTDVLLTASNFVDVVGFLPVVMHLYKVELDDDDATGVMIGTDVHEQMRWFCTLSAGFYLWEDVLDPIYHTAGFIIYAAHFVHFALVVDFVGQLNYEVNSKTQNQQQAQKLGGYEEMTGLLSKEDGEIL